MFLGAFFFHTLSEANIFRRNRMSRDCSASVSEIVLILNIVFLPHEYFLSIKLPSPLQYPLMNSACLSRASNMNHRGNDLFFAPDLNSCLKSLAAKVLQSTSVTPFLYSLYSNGAFPKNFSKSSFTSSIYFRSFLLKMKFT